MELAQLLAFNAALLVAMASPGPALLVLTQTAISAGRARAIWTGVGLAVMAATWTLMALLGLETIFTLFPATYVGLKTAGALYLIWIAYQTWKAARTPLPEAVRVKPGKAFRRGLMINLANPKSVLFSAGVLVVIFPPNLSAPQIILVTANHLAVEIIVYSLLASALNRPAARRAYLSAKSHLDRLAAVVLGGLGVRLLVERAP
ncbi:LysE family translocator [Tropicimonas sp. S265A]|uniref:LysE family translocator n=1 Tax=Tropicimonas sp. S265A TaxID=3415134 RepID=UPI003C7ED1CB